MKSSQEDYDAYQRRYKKERVLMELFARDTPPTRWSWRS